MTDAAWFLPPSPCHSDVDIINTLYKIFYTLHTPFLQFGTWDLGSGTNEMRHSGPNTHNTQVKCLWKWNEINWTTQQTWEVIVSKLFLWVKLQSHKSYLNDIEREKSKSELIKQYIMHDITLKRTLNICIYTVLLFKLPVYQGLYIILMHDVKEFCNFLFLKVIQIKAHSRMTRGLSLN